MAARNVRQRPVKRKGSAPGRRKGASAARGQAGAARGGKQERYRPLPTGTHGLDPEAVKSDQRARLQQALIELIAEKGYPAVRIVDLAKLAHVSQPTFYNLYADKEDLFLSVLDKVAHRTGRRVLKAYCIDSPHRERAVSAMRAWAALAAAEPEETSLLALGAFGAGARALAHRSSLLAALERRIQAGRSAIVRGTDASAEAQDPDALIDPADLTVKGILGGIREVTAVRLREGRASELPGFADALTAWAACYPRVLPAGLRAPVTRRGGSDPARAAASSERARRAEGRLPSGRSDLPRPFIVKSQRERIVDAIAAIVAERGLAALTVPEIARRANVSHQTFYDMYGSKHDAFLGAHKVGMHQALVVTVDAYREHEHDWPAAARAGVHALLRYLASEPAHAHLSLVDTFGTCPQAIEIRAATLRAFAAYLAPGYELARERTGAEVPAIAGEAIAGGIWEILHHYVENDSLAELPGAAPQLTYFALAPFLGPAAAAAYARPDSA